MNDDDERESSSHPLLPTGGFSSASRGGGGGDSPLYYPPPTSSRKSYLSLLKRPLSLGWILLVLGSIAAFALSLGLRGGSGSGGSWSRTSQVEGWSWKTRPKAREGLVKAGGRRARNESYTGNLLPTINYITSFHIAGLNNEIMTQFNLLHLTFLLRKNPASPYPYVPILSPFLPHFNHLGGGEGLNAAPLLRFSQVFDIDRLAESLGFGIIEWSDLKVGDPGEGMGGRIEDEWKTEEEREEERKLVLAGKKVERIGQGLKREVMSCWSTWQTTHQGNKISPSLGEYYNFKMSYTPLPPSVFAATDRQPRHVLFPVLANLLSPPENRLRTEYLSFTSDEAERNIESWGKNMTLADVFTKKKEPNDDGWVEPNTNPGQVTCFDVLYYGSDKGEEVREIYRATPPVPRNAGPWWSVGQYAHWNPELRAIGVNTLRQVLGMPAGKTVPDIFTVHIRRTDFMPSCPAYAQPCLAVSHFANHVNAMRDRFVKNGTRKAADWPVVVTTDESDPEYLAEIASLGWFLVDHHALRTRPIHGIWYPSLIDNVILAFGQGFVGTQSSTMSILASRRVEDWNGGKAERVGALETKWPYDPASSEP